MLRLQTISNIFLAVFIQLVIFTQAAYGIQTVNYIVSVVDDDIIVRTELDEALGLLRLQLEQQKVALPPKDLLEKQVLERLIIQHIQMQLASQSGINVDDETISTTIRHLAEKNQVTLTEFRALLEKEGYNFNQFRENIRRQLIIGRLQQREVANHITVTDQEVEDFLASTQARIGEGSSGQKEWHLAQIVIAIPEGAGPERIQIAREKTESLMAQLHAGANFETLARSTSAGREALEGGDLGWRGTGQIPSLFSSTVPGMQKGGIAGPLRGPAGFHILKLIDVRDHAALNVVQTRARHILIRTNENTTGEEARSRLTQLRLRIQGGEDFGTLARVHSEDSATANNQGLLGWVSPGDLVPEFEQIMNSLAPSVISEPFKTSFGWHLLQVLERRQQVSNQETLHTQALEAIRTRKTEEELEAWLRRVREEAYVEVRLDLESGSFGLKPRNQ